MGEKGKISIRNIRREANEDLKKKLKAKTLSEDQNKSFEKININRIALTLEDKIARDKIIKWMKNLNLTIKIDNIGNIFGFYNFKKNTKPFLLGSHIDTVRNAGRFDGSLGVIGALEVLETLIKNNVTNKPIGIAIFTNEEGVRFTPDMMGSWSFTKRENINKIYKIKDNNNITIKDALKKIRNDGIKRKQVGIELDCEPLLGPNTTFWIIMNKSEKVGKVT